MWGNTSVVVLIVMFLVVHVLSNVVLKYGLILTLAFLFLFGCDPFLFCGGMSTEAWASISSAPPLWDKELDRIKKHS